MTPRELNQSKSHNTEAEIAFIRTMGRFSFLSEYTPRRTLLTGYIASTEKRTDWTGIDRQAVIDAAQHELATLVEPINGVLA